MKEINKEIEEINWHLNNVNDVKNIYEFVEISDETTKEEALQTVQDLFEIIRACQDTIESIFIGVNL